MELTVSRVREVARLARLLLTEEEERTLAGELTRILEHVEKLAELDLEGVEPTSYAVPLVGVRRADVVVPSLSRKEVLGNAPAADGECFLVPRVVRDQS